MWLFFTAPEILITFIMVKRLKSDLLVSYANAALGWQL